MPHLALLYAVQPHVAELMAQCMELLQGMLEDWAQQEQLLVQGGLGCCQLCAVYG